MTQTKNMVGASLVCLVTTIGCFHHSFTVGSGGNLDNDAKYSRWESHWLLGIIGESDVDVKTVCPSGNATLKDEVSFLNGLVGAFIGIIWYPSTVEVYCGSEGKTASITLRPDQLRAIALRPEVQAWAHSVSEVGAAKLDGAIREYRETESNVASTGAPARF